MLFLLLHLAVRILMPCFLPLSTQRLLTSVIEPPFFFPEARVTRLRSRVRSISNCRVLTNGEGLSTHPTHTTLSTPLPWQALQEMRLNDEPLQDDPPYHSSPGYGPRPRRAVGKQLRTQREQHRAALQAIQPVMLNGQEEGNSVKLTNDAPFSL
jgi:hypothetical protein